MDFQSSNSQPQHYGQVVPSVLASAGQPLDYKEGGKSLRVALHINKRKQKLKGAI